MEERNNDRLEEVEEKVKVLYERFMKLGLEKRPSYEELRKAMTPSLSVGSIEVE